MYDYQLASIHDQWFADLAENAARLVLDTAVNPQGPIVDLGCGSGNLLAQFNTKIKEGYGFDISSEMIKRAKTKSPGYHFQTRHLFETTVPEAQIITAVGEILSYATYDLREAETNIEALFNDVYSKLRPDGLFLFDFITSDHNFNYERVFEKEAFTVKMHSTQKGDQITRVIESHLKEDKSGHTPSFETHYLRAFDVKKLQELLIKCGFNVTKLNAYGKYLLPPGRLAFLCRQ